MIKFFRKIRQKIIEQNKVRNYFFYAIGEIFLVVIGILIALQINNWNETRKRNLDIKNGLIEVRNNLVNDSIPLSRTIELFTNEITLQKELLDHLSKQELLDSTFNVHLGKSIVVNSFQLVSNGYNTLKTYGLKNLDDPTLENNRLVAVL